MLDQKLGKPVKKRKYFGEFLELFCRQLLNKFSADALAICVVVLGLKSHRWKKTQCLFLDHTQLNTLPPRYSQHHL